MRDFHLVIKLGGFRPVRFCLRNEILVGTRDAVGIGFTMHFGLLGKVAVRRWSWVLPIKGGGLHRVIVLYFLAIANAASGLD